MDDCGTRPPECLRDAQTPGAGMRQRRPDGCGGSTVSARERGAVEYLHRFSSRREQDLNTVAGGGRVIARATFDRPRSVATRRRTLPRGRPGRRFLTSRAARGVARGRGSQAAHAAHRRTAAHRRRSTHRRSRPVCRILPSADLLRSAERNPSAGGGDGPRVAVPWRHDAARQPREWSTPRSAGARVVRGHPHRARRGSGHRPVARQCRRGCRRRRRHRGGDGFGLLRRPFAQIGSPRSLGPPRPLGRRRGGGCRRRGCRGRG